MASTPKRRRRSKGASHPTTETQSQSGPMSQEDRETMIRTCMASIIPTIEDTFRRYMDEYHHGESSPSLSNPMQTAPPQQQSAETQQASSQASVTPDHSLLQEITSQGMQLINQNTDGDSRSATGLTLNVDSKIRAKIYANEFIKFAILLPSDSDHDETDKYRSVDKNGELIFIKANERGPIKSINKWVEAFHIFVAIYAEKFPHEIGNLMTYAHTVQKIADSCGDSAALMYDEKFRRWREKEPSLCAWEKKNIELYQEALVSGLDFKLKFRNQPFRAQAKSNNYCYSYNNVGSCTKSHCPHQHICQYCGGKHPRRQCHNRPKQTFAKQNARKTNTNSNQQASTKQ